MTDKLTEALRVDDPRGQLNRDQTAAGLVHAAARRWRDFPTDDDVEALARHQRPGIWWDERELWPGAVALYLDNARAALEAVKRGDR